MSLKLRTERASDYRETENVAREAFWNRYAPGCCEHYLLCIMRDCPDFLPELDFVAEYDGRIVGNVVCVKTSVEGDDGHRYEVLCLGPISVLPEFQGRSIGRELIERAQETGREMGFRAIVLCGDPEYYSCRGFVSAERFGIRTADDLYLAALQVCELQKGALAGVSGRYIEHPVYEVDPSAAEGFDGTFPAKEKYCGTLSQQRFTELAAMHRSAFGGEQSGMVETYDNVRSGEVGSHHERIIFRPGKPTWQRLAATLIAFLIFAGVLVYLSLQAK